MKKDIGWVWWGVYSGESRFSGANKFSGANDPRNIAAVIR